MRFLTTHDKFSFAKSGLRIIGYMCLLVSLWGAAAILVVAEILGVLEEL
jgi:uncharacterized membrane protein